MINWDEYLRYLDGKLIWKFRAVTDDNRSNDLRFNKVFAGKETGCIFKAAKSKANYLRVSLNHKYYLAHRIVWEMHNGKITDGMTIDHINGDGTDNRIENLRLVDSAINHKNRPIYSNNASGCTGVSWDKKSKKWRARVSINGSRKSVYLGSDLNEAVAAAKLAMSQLGYHENHGRP